MRHIVRALGLAGTILTLVLTGLTSMAQPVAAAGHDPSACRPDDPRVAIPDGFYFDACFDGQFIVLINRAELPVYVDLTGDLQIVEKSPTAALPALASRTFNPLAPHLLVPDYRMRIEVGANGGDVKLGYAADTGRSYGIAKQVSSKLPGLFALPDVAADLFNELDDVLVNATNCMNAASNFLERGVCTGRLSWDVDFATKRAVLAGILAVGQVPTVVEAILTPVTALADVEDLVQDVAAYNASPRAITIPSGLLAPAGNPGGGGTPPTIPAAPVGAVSLTIAGTCTSDGGTLRGVTGGFTAGGAVTYKAWYPDGSAYSNLDTEARAGTDGAAPFSWDCAGDPAGTYNVELLDDSTGRSTGRVPFEIGAPPQVTSGPTASSPPSEPSAPLLAPITVSNRVTADMSMVEDSTSSYLSTVPARRCRPRDCMVPGTEMWTGTVLAATCVRSGEETTNGNNNAGATGDDANSERFTSSTYYGVRWPDGQFGYISEVWIRASDRGGKGLPAC